LVRLGIVKVYEGVSLS